MYANSRFHQSRLTTSDRIYIMLRESRCVVGKDHGALNFSRHF